MSKTAKDFVILEEKHNQEAMILLTAEVTKQVDEFTEGWYRDMAEKHHLEAKVDIPLEDAMKIFADLDMAADMLTKEGFDVIHYEEEYHGWLWWKKITPAHIVILPRKGRRRRN